MPSSYCYDIAADVIDAVWLRHWLIMIYFTLRCRRYLSFIFLPLLSPTPAEGDCLMMPLAAIDTIFAIIFLLLISCWCHFMPLLSRNIIVDYWCHCLIMRCGIDADSLRWLRRQRPLQYFDIHLRWFSSLISLRRWLSLLFFLHIFILYHVSLILFACWLLTAIIEADFLQLTCLSMRLIAIFWLIYASLPLRLLLIDFDAYWLMPTTPSMAFPLRRHRHSLAAAAASCWCFWCCRLRHAICCYIDANINIITNIVIIAMYIFIYWCLLMPIGKDISFRHAIISDYWLSMRPLWHASYCHDDYYFSLLHYYINISYWLLILPLYINIYYH